MEGVVKEVVKSTEPAVGIIEEIICERHLLDDVVGKVVNGLESIAKLHWIFIPLLPVRFWGEPGRF